MSTFPTFPLLDAGVMGRAAPGSSLSHSPRVLRAGFGGAYEQRTGDGINTDPRTFTVRYENLDRGQAKTIEDFLRTQKGYLPFMHPIPGSATNVVEMVQFTCADWSRAFNEVEYETITATLVENYDP